MICEINLLCRQMLQGFMGNFYLYQYASGSGSVISIPIRR